MLGGFSSSFSSSFFPCGNDKQRNCVQELKERDQDMAGQEGKREVKNCKGNSGESLHYTIFQNRAQQDKVSQAFSFLSSIAPRGCRWYI